MTELNEPSYPEWHPERHPEYDTHMGHVCFEVLEQLRIDAQYRADFLADTRAVHRRLYDALTPEGFPEYAGTLRGTPGTSLTTRRAGAQSVTGQPAPIAFTEPDQVQPTLDTLQKFLQLAARKSSASRDDRLRLVTIAFVMFGKTHPFLDGNGHVQRLLFAALSFHIGLDVLPTWTIHPRPYDLAFAQLLETYHLNGGDLASLIEALAAFVK